MSRILIDLTDLELWNGNHGGTQRVVYGIAKNYFLDQDTAGQKVTFMSFSNNDKAFHISSFAPIYVRVENLKSDSSSGGLEAGLSRKAKLKYLLRPYVPESLKKNVKLRRIAVQSAHSVIYTARTLRGLSRRKIPAMRNTATPMIVFNNDDTVLMLGKPWDNLDIQRTLTKEKNSKNFKLVQVVYDLVIPLHPHLHHPSLFVPYTQHMFEVVAASDLLLPISQSTAVDLKRFCDTLNLQMPAVKVIRLGDELVSSTVADKPDSRIDKKFIACVGTIEIRKNHTLLYYAYKLAAERGIRLPQLILLGGQGWLSGDLQYLVQHDPAMNDKILILNNVSDSGLNWVYNNCLFTIYPSMYEGWGLPVAESLAYGKFCIASGDSSVPEIAGSLIDYFSPYDANDCLKSIVTAMDEQYLKEKVKNLSGSYKITTWKQTYGQVVQAIKAMQA